MTSPQPKRCQFVDERVSKILGALKWDLNVQMNGTSHRQECTQCHRCTLQRRYYSEFVIARTRSTVECHSRSRPKGDVMSLTTRGSRNNVWWLWKDSRHGMAAEEPIAL